MKKAYSKSTRRVHSEYLSNSFQTTVLFLLIVSITALAFSSCSTAPSASKKQGNNETSSISKTKLSTGNRTVEPQIGKLN